MFFETFNFKIKGGKLGSFGSKTEQFITPLFIFNGFGLDL